MSINIGKYVAKGVGVATLYLVGRDAHVCGKIKSDEYRKTKDAEAAAYYCFNAATVDKPSTTKIKMQNAIRDYDLDHNVRGFINSAIGYFKGMGSMLISDVVPLGLGLTALFAKGKALPLAKISAGALAVMGAFSFVTDGLGLGKQKSKIDLPLQ